MFNEISNKHIAFSLVLEIFWFCLNRFLVIAYLLIIIYHICLSQKQNYQRIEKKIVSHDRELAALPSKPKWGTTQITYRHNTKENMVNRISSSFPKCGNLTITKISRYTECEYSTYTDVKTSNTENHIRSTAPERSVI